LQADCYAGVWAYHANQQFRVLQSGDVEGAIKAASAVGDDTLQLTLMEAQLLHYLIQNTGHPVSRKSILENVWDLHEDTDTRAIDNFMVRLRRYIEKQPSKPQHLITVRGLGYEFIPFPEKTTK